MEPRQPASAWQPFTPRGVAAFAGAPLGRLLAVQSVVALVAALAIAWAISQAWYHAIGTAIDALPAGAEIRYATLLWPGTAPQRLADTPFLALAVDLDHTGQVRSPAHLLVEFGRHNARVISLFGYLDVDYRPGWVIAFNREELKPAWGAWSVPLLGLTAMGSIVLLLGTWAFMATIYAGPAWLFAFFANRDLRWRGSWFICGAALMPGAVFMSAILLVYGLGACDLVRLLAALGLHLVIGWGFIIAGVLASPRHPEVQPLRTNPFVQPRAK